MLPRTGALHPFAMRVPGTRRIQSIVGLLLLVGVAICQPTDTASAAKRNVPAAEDPALGKARNAVRMRDFEKAVRIWRAAAKRGNPRARYRLGVAYRSGRGVAQDPAKAAYWFGKAASSGDADAQYALGKLYEKGLGVRADRGRAMEWIGEAARSGHREAKRALARMQRSGAGSSSGTRATPERKDPRERLARAIRLGETDAARDALVRGAPVDGAPGDERHWRPLLLAIDRSRPKIVDLLLKHGADPDQTSRLGEPALIVAIRSKERRIVQRLLRAGADPNAPSPRGDRPLMEAARLGLTPIVDDLLAADADPKATLDNGASAADLARRFGFGELAHRLRRAGAPTLERESETDRLAALESNRRGQTDAERKSSLPPLIEAARRGDDGLLREILTSGAEPGIRDPAGDSALHHAADGGHVEAIRILLDAGLEPDLRGAKETTSLMRAMASTAEGSDEVVEILLARGADPHLRDHLSAGIIRYAADGATPRKLRLLKRAGGSWSDLDASHALERAAGGGRMTAVRALLDIAEKSSSRTAAVCGAISAEQDETLGALLEMGLDLDQPCSDGRTALMIATQLERDDIIARLLAAGASPDGATRNGDTPLIAAASRGYQEIVEHLLEAGARIDQRGARRMTALMGAASNGRVDVVRTLLEHRADRRMRSDSGDTALKLARAAGHEDVARMIEAYKPGWSNWFGTR